MQYMCTVYLLKMICAWQTVLADLKESHWYNPPHEVALGTLLQKQTRPQNCKGYTRAHVVSCSLQIGPNVRISHKLTTGSWAHVLTAASSNSGALCLFVYASLSFSVSRPRHTEIFQCFLSAREAARSRERERASSSTGLGLSSTPRSAGSGGGGASSAGGGGGGEEEPTPSLEERRDSTGLPEGQDLYTAACNSVIHRCALLVLGVSPVLGELGKQNQEEGGPLTTGPGGVQQEGVGFMTR